MPHRSGWRKGVKNSRHEARAYHSYTCFNTATQKTAHTLLTGTIPLSPRSLDVDGVRLYQSPSFSLVRLYMKNALPVERTSVATLSLWERQANRKVTIMPSRKLLARWGVVVQVRRTRTAVRMKRRCVKKRSILQRFLSAK